VDLIRNLFTTCSRLLVTAGLLWTLSARVDLGGAKETMEHASVPLLGLALAALLATVPVNALRWHVILKAAGLSLPRSTLLKLLFVGLFFNQVLPSGIGGDAVRVWRCRRLGVDLTAAVRSVLLDRASGYFVLVIIYAATLPVLLDLLPTVAQRGIGLAMLCLTISAMLALGFADRLPSRMFFRFLGPLAELSQETRRLFGSPKISGIVLGLSAVTVGLTTLACMLVGDSLGTNLPFASWLLVLPPITFIQLLPISLAGWGVREVGLVVALTTFGIPAETALANSLLIGFCLIVVGLPGGLIWVADWDVARPHMSTNRKRSISWFRAGSSI
jgi:glycosyltransferase 2 family protein